jgi:endo-1,3-1,4-beta-glycanase ExoK
VKKLTGVIFFFGFICLGACFNENSNQNQTSTEEIDDAIIFTVHIAKFEELFSSKLTKVWKIRRHSFPGNGCDMLDSQVIIKNSNLVLLVELNEKYKEKPYKGGEISCVFPFLYGQFSVRMKNEIAPGTVSSFFIMNKWRPENWEQKEIDIEFLGKNTRAVQFTVHHFMEEGKKHLFYEHTHKLNFDSSDDFHEYSILWTRDSISWLIDGKWVYSEKRILLDEEMYIRMNHWAADTINNNGFIKWLGLIDTINLPSKVFYDYVKYSPLTN